MQIKVDEAVHQQSPAAGPSAQTKRVREGIVARFQEAQRTDEYGSDEPGAAKSADQACSGQSFQVIIVRMIYDFSVIPGFVRRIHLLQSSQARSQHRMIQKNLPR